MGKTPYELRYDLLVMAQAIVTENLMNERIRLENDWNLEREKASIALSQNKDVTLPPFPRVPEINVLNIIALAQTRNHLVSKSD